MRIQWSPLAVDRVCEVADYISQDDPIMDTVWHGADFINCPDLQQMTVMEDSLKGCLTLFGAAD